MRENGRGEEERGEEILLWYHGHPCACDLWTLWSTTALTSAETIAIYGKMGDVTAVSEWRHSFVESGSRWRRFFALVECSTFHLEQWLRMFHKGPLTFDLVLLVTNVTWTKKCVDYFLSYFLFLEVQKSGDLELLSCVIVYQRCKICV